MKRCTKCVLPENYPGIKFDEAGVCNYCLNHKKRRYKGKEELDKILGSFRNKDGKYDCAVGISGGRDSSYALYYLVKEYNLRVIAYTGDNGFIPDAAKANMKNLTDMLGVELVTEEYDYLKRCVKNNISALLRRPTPQMIQLICCGCRFGIARGMSEYARKNKIPWIVVGGGTPVEICYYKRAFFNTNLFGRKSGPFLMLLALIFELVKNPFYLTPTSASVFVAEYFYYLTGGIRGLFYPNQKMLRLYHYIEWDEDKILSTIKTELNWTKGDSVSSWRADCRINFIRNYLLREGFGFTEKDDYFSNMIRENMITREEALERLKNEAIVPQEAINELCDEIGLDPSDLRVAVEMARRNALRKK